MCYTLSMIYAFIGLKGSGKTTACNYLKTKLPDVKHINFKDALIREIKENFPDVLRLIAEYQYRGGYGFHPDDNVDELIDLLFIEKPPLIRTLMQNYGTELRRKENPNYWVDRWNESVAKVAEVQDGKISTNIVCDDVRFVNEYDAVKALGGITIRLIRADIVATDGHQSETEQASLVANYTIECEKDNLDKLYTALDDILVKTQPPIMKQFQIGDKVKVTFIDGTDYIGFITGVDNGEQKNKPYQIDRVWTYSDKSIVVSIEAVE